MKRRILFILLLLFAAAVFIFEKEEYVATFGSADFSETEERANELIKELYKNGVNFIEERGDGTVYVKRYYCSNICVDVLSDGSIRYLSDENDADNEDKFLKWLNKGGGAKIVYESEFYGFLVRKVKNNGITCNLCIEKADGRVVAARIIFNS